MLLGNIENARRSIFYSCLHGSQEIDCINTINITFYRIYNIFIDVGHHNFSPYPESFCNFQQNSRPCRVWLYNTNSYKKQNFHRNSMILHLLSTQMLRYKLVKFKTYLHSFKLQICSHYLLDDPRTVEQLFHCCIINRNLGVFNARFVRKFCRRLRVGYMQK